MSKHTPGPWTWNGTFPIRIIDAEGFVVCDGIIPREEDNARLIAAAPDLLAALKYLLDNQGDYSSDGIALCRKAIAKAEGK
jgi:hypothetical protein